MTSSLQALCIKCIVGNLSALPDHLLEEIIRDKKASMYSEMEKTIYRDLNDDLPEVLCEMVNDKVTSLVSERNLFDYEREMGVDKARLVSRLADKVVESQYNRLMYPARSPGGAFDNYSEEEYDEENNEGDVDFYFSN